MKRLFALLLALLMLLSAGAALAEDEVTTIEEKFARQVQVSAYRGNVTFSVTGTGTKALNASTWLILRSLAPRLSIQTEHSFINRTKQGQASLSLLLDETPLAKADLRYDNQLMGLSSTLLTPDDVYYTAARDWDVKQLLQTAVQGENAWPSSLEIILAARTAPEAWKTRLLERLTPYETKLGVWLNSYASFETGEIEDVSYTELSCAIPVRAAKAEIKQLMIDFYNDAEFLSLLREVVSPQTAAAYLQPGMMTTFFYMLDAMELEGDVEVVRRYSAQGKLLLDMMTLPFPESSPITNLTITLRPDEFGNCWGLTGQTSFGLDFDLTCVVGEEMIYTGSVELLLPPEKNDPASFIVSDSEPEEPERRAVAFDYNFSWDPGEQTYTLANSSYTRNTQGTLLIKPRDGEMPMQTLSLNYTLSTGVKESSTTQLNGTLTWHDMDSDATITATLQSRTLAPFAVASLNGADSTLRVDLLSRENLTALTQRWLQTAEQQFQTILAKLTTSVFSFTTTLQ